ncbi:glycoside hydrolase family 68 protein [Halegenticoccus tardaugens]|uniref:glycoside hydrolase family 68 protein n=1 Tax=Halegenticoccus tardaugens TaxID=2071624 RepID=UPI00100BE73A|nr:glycoside hydrolase family 68 protein [Halegenticoccus tardaugens]
MNLESDDLLLDRDVHDTPAWTRAHAAGIERSDENVAPIIYPPDAPLDPDLHVWDTWFLRRRDGSVAEIDGYRVIFALSSSSALLPGKRHDVATIRYFYSRDGREWTTGGPVFEGSEPLGSRQWAGSALYDDGEVFAYYTASGRRGEAELTYTQRIALGRGGSVETDGDGLRIVGPWEHSVLLEPDGERYETEAQSRGMTYTFRDPWFFEDDGRTYLLFEANTPVPEDSAACGGDAAQREFNGSVGIAESPTGDPAAFELRPPLLDAVCVNQELERPHLIVRDGTYYLFVSSHDHTFAPGLDGYDALYGFAADSLRGDYEPLNGSGLVLTNPWNAPFQAYSWLADDHGDEALVTAFFNYFDFDRPSLDDVAHLPESEQLRRFGGTLAPTVRLRLDGRRTRVVGTLDHGHLPLPDEELPEPWWEPGEDVPVREYLTPPEADAGDGLLDVAETDG